MSTESELLTWKTLGLPSDDLSQENGLVITNLQDLTPLIIDPASAAVEWLKNILSKNPSSPLEVISHHDKRFSNQVELAVRFGKTLIVLEVDGVEPMLYPLCRRDLCHQGPRYVVTVGEKVIDFNEGFRLFLVTRNPEPDVPPDAASLVTVVNFTVTRSGLEGQLLGIGNFLLIYICNFHVLNHFLLIHICKLYWNQQSNTNNQSWRKRKASYLNAKKISNYNSQI